MNEIVFTDDGKGTAESVTAKVSVSGYTNWDGEIGSYNAEIEGSGKDKEQAELNLGWQLESLLDELQD